MFATGVTMGLAEWVIDDSCLSTFALYHQTLAQVLYSVPVSLSLLCYCNFSTSSAAFETGNGEREYGKIVEEIKCNG